MNRVPLLRRAEFFSITTINPHPVLRADLTLVDAFPKRMFHLSALDKRDRPTSRTMWSRIITLHPEIDLWCDDETSNCQFYLCRQTEVIHVGPIPDLDTEGVVEQELGLHFNDPAEAVKFALRWL